MNKMFTGSTLIEVIDSNVYRIFEFLKAKKLDLLKRLDPLTPPV